MEIFKSKLLLALTGAFFTTVFSANSQVLVESIAAVAGNEVIYLSDIENSILDMRRNGEKKSVDQLRCPVLQDLLISKLFLEQARIDSIEVTDDMVEGNLNMQMNNNIKLAGSEKVLEEYFGRSIAEIRQDVRKALIDQQIVSEVQSKIAADVTLTPSQLKRYYMNIPKDSIPVIPEQVEISIIQINPPGNEENKAEARQKLLDIRSQILSGKSFSVLAVMYSEDPSNATKGGELGYQTRGTYEKEFADAAFTLSKNSISKIVETRYGFHIIQLIDRKGDMANLRHILIRPKVKAAQAEIAINRLDSIADAIRKDSISFENAAKKMSSHKDSRTNGGKYILPNTTDRNTWLKLDELDQDMYKKVRDLKIGEISEPFKTTDESGNEVYRIVRLDNELAAHRANIKDDYQLLYDAALMQERSKIYDHWIKKKIESTYIKISDEYSSCEFLKEGWLK